MGPIEMAAKEEKQGRQRNNNAKGKMIKKENLPQKVCVVCGRPFNWRKKWERCWDEVTTCSKACNGQRRKNNKE